MTVQEATFYLLNKLKIIYHDSEASIITDWVMEAITGAAKAERMVYKNEALSAAEEYRLLDAAKRLSNHEPVQYVLGFAWFSGLRLQVNNHVLIPRPETDELVHWIASDYKKTATNSVIKILDIGTGSGCIPIALKKKLPNADVNACDISKDALQLATTNANTLHTPTSFIHADILDENTWEQFGQYDIIVSNPPYIPEKDKVTMQENVLAHEPHLALFVPNDDALLFYQKIAQFAKKHLSVNGQLYFEIHENFGDATIKILQQYGFRCELRKDMQQKDRMIKSGLY
jgi:release factor glutamine methyltransferase